MDDPIRHIFQLLEKAGLSTDYDVTLSIIHSEKIVIHFVRVISSANWKDQADSFRPSKLGSGKKKIRIWEDQLVRSGPIVLSRLNSMIGLNKKVYARNTEVCKIEAETANRFLKENHLSAPAKAKHLYGLYQSNDLLALATFSRSCPVHREGIEYRSHELVRFCSQQNISVIGGLSKLIQHFVREHSPEDIMTYADREWSSGLGYLNLGFSYIDSTVPTTFWLSPGLDRYYDHQMSTYNKAQLVRKGWKKIENAGNLKLVKLFK